MADRHELHDVLERESERYTLPPGAAERMFERGARRARNRKRAAIGLSAILFVGILAIIRTSMPDGDREVVPATRRSVAGTYTVELSDTDPRVELLGMRGRYEMRLLEDGTLTIVSPRRFDLPGDPSTFTVTDGRMTTDALVGSECKELGTYRVRHSEGRLTLVPIEEPCELRRILFASRPWRPVTVPGATDPLQGEWTATFRCEQMLQAVHAADVAPSVEAFWKAALADQYADGPAGPEDLAHPCRDAPQPLTSMFRFTDGRLQIFDPPDLFEGFDGHYEMRDGVITISDGSDRNIDGRYRVAFRIDGDRVTFDLLGRAATDAFFVAAWESAPFVRTA
jgi:hypothetical protein